MNPILAIIQGSLLYLTLFIFVPLMVIYLNTQLGLARFAPFPVTGIIFILLGVALFLYCTKLFWFIGSGTPAPTEPPQHLIITDIYHYTRNPIYIAYFLIWIGQALYFGYSSLYLYSLTMMILIHLYVVKTEEPMLIKRFGKEYRDYMQKVPRWFFKI